MTSDGTKFIARDIALQDVGIALPYAGFTPGIVRYYLETYQHINRSVSTEIGINCLLVVTIALIMIGWGMYLRLRAFTGASEDEQQQIIGLHKARRDRAALAGMYAACFLIGVLSFPALFWPFKVALAVAAPFVCYLLMGAIVKLVVRLNQQGQRGKVI